MVHNLHTQTPPLFHRLMQAAIEPFLGQNTSFQKGQNSICGVQSKVGCPVVWTQLSASHLVAQPLGPGNGYRISVVAWSNPFFSWLDTMLDGITFMNTWHEKCTSSTRLYMAPDSLGFIFPQLMAFLPSSSFATPAEEV